jgi:hypothetical protein
MCKLYRTMGNLDIYAPLDQVFLDILNNDLPIRFCFLPIVLYNLIQCDAKLSEMFDALNFYKKPVKICVNCIELWEEKLRTHNLDIYAPLDQVFLDILNNDLPIRFCFLPIGTMGRKQNRIGRSLFKMSKKT